MSDIVGKFVVLAITRNEARIWATGLQKGANPERIFAPDEKGAHHHVRQMQHHGGHSSDPAVGEYFDLLVSHLAQAEEILLIGHGEGKANAMLQFLQYIERHNPNVARKVIGAIDTDLNAMTNDQVLAKSREWFDKIHK